MQQDQIKTAFKEELSELFSSRYEVILEEKGISERDVSRGAISEVIERQYDSSVDDFLSETKEAVDENNYRDVVRIYLQENFDSDFVTVQIESNIAENSKYNSGIERIRNECNFAIDDYKNLKRSVETFMDNLENYNQTAMKYDSKIVEVYDLIISHNVGEINIEILNKLKTSEFDGYFRNRKLDVRGYGDYFLVDVRFFQLKEESELAQMANRCSHLYRNYLTELDDLYLKCAFQE